MILRQIQSSIQVVIKDIDIDIDIEVLSKDITLVTLQ